jgi:RimJ/RimL family protein N-acetyltransferase
VIQAPELLVTERLTLEPLRLDHAEELYPVLDDQALHEFIGGRPATLDELRQRFESQSAGGPADGSQGWLNWVVRRRGDGVALGTVQATITEEEYGVAATVAWVIGTAYQGQGYGREAARQMVAWLRRRGVAVVLAFVNPDHLASAAVAQSLGLAPSDTVVDGEVLWKSGSRCG